MAREGGVPFRWRFSGVARDPLHHFKSGFRLKRMSAGRQLVQNQAEGEDVACASQRFTAALLRRHVTQRSGQYTGYRKRIRLIIRSREPSGQSEIQHLDAAV